MTEARRELREAGVDSELRTVEVNGERAARIETGDVDASDL